MLNKVWTAWLAFTAILRVKTEKQRKAEEFCKCCRSYFFYPKSLGVWLATWLVALLCHLMGPMFDPSLLSGYTGTYVEQLFHPVP